MLNVNQLYAHYNLVPNGDNSIEFCGKQIIVYATKLFIVCLEQHQDPFAWLSSETDSIVFETSSGCLAMMILFDSEKDETDNAYETVNRLVGVLQ